jgi:hypothetical protein
LAINESWLKDGQDKRAPAPPGYRLRHIPRPSSIRARGGGVGFYIRDGIHVRQIKHPLVSEVEQMWIRVTLNRLRFAIGTAYRPPWLKIDTFVDALTETISSFAGFDHIILMGDFNVNMLAVDDTNTKKITTFLRYLRLEQYVTRPTHFTDHSETLIDLVCSTTRILNIAVDYIPELSSHAFISCNLRINKIKPPPRWIVYRPLKYMNMKDFDDLVNSINWELLLVGNVSESLSCFNAYILYIFDTFAPIIRSQVKRRSYPWITFTIKQMIKLRDNAYTKSRSTKKESDIAYYKELKSIVNKAMTAEKSAYFRENINKYCMDSKKLWKNIRNDVADFKQNSTRVPPNLGNADDINKYFIDVPGDNHVTISTLTFFEYHRHGSSTFSLKSVDELTVSKLIMSIGTNAEGVDCITRDMILLTLPRTLKVITAIINRSLQSGIFPDIWKVARVKPIPKTNTPAELKDLRPISILPFMSKIIEKVVCQQLAVYLAATNILPQRQSGFRSNHSTSTALLDVVDDILAGQDIGRGSILVLLDFSRAFDCINHNLLISKLAFY